MSPATGSCPRGCHRRAAFWPLGLRLPGLQLRLRALAASETLSPEALSSEPQQNRKNLWGGISDGLQLGDVWDVIRGRVWGATAAVQLPHVPTWFLLVNFCWQPSRRT